MDRQWDLASLSLDKKVDRITYGGAIVQAMVKKWDFLGFTQRARGGGERGARGAGELTIDVTRGSKDRLGISAWQNWYNV